MNYLLASFVLSSFAELSRGVVAWATNPGLPMRSDIPTQRNLAVACEFVGYVRNDLIGIECNARYAPGLRRSIEKFRNLSACSIAK